MNLLRLARITGDGALTMVGEQTIRAFMGKARQQPAAYLQLLMAHGYRFVEPVQVTLSGPRDGAEMKSLLAVLHRHFLPGLVVRHVEDAREDAPQAPAGKAAAHVCAAGACLPPVTEVAELEELLARLV
jgi:uncharacterized protein YyaL (SSP411 family)